MFHVKYRDAEDWFSSSERLIARAAHLEIALSSDEAGSLLRFGELLRSRALPLGLVSRNDAERILERHLLDCLRATPFLSPADELVMDLGAGAGLPGIVLAVAAPLCRFLLVESRAKAVGFLEFAIETLRLANTDVFPGRAEQVEERADVVTARAFAPIGRAWPIAATLLKSGGRLIYFAGRRFDRRETSVDRLMPPPASVDVLANSQPLVIMTAP